jgi:hypothetical protein
MVSGHGANELSNLTHIAKNIRPAIAGAESGSALATHRSLRNRLANDRKRSVSLCPVRHFLSHSSFRNSFFAISSLKKLRGRSADRRNCLVSTPRKAHVTTRSAPGAWARIRARTPTVAPPRLLHRRTNATAQPQAALPGTRLKDGCYPSPPVPVEAYSATPLADGALLIRLPRSGTPCPGLMPIIGVLFLRIQGRAKSRPVRGGPVIEDKTDRSGKMARGIRPDYLARPPSRNTTACRGSILEFRHRRAPVEEEVTPPL